MAADARLLEEQKRLARAKEQALKVTMEAAMARLQREKLQKEVKLALREKEDSLIRTQNMKKLAQAKLDAEKRQIEAIAELDRKTREAQLLRENQARLDTKKALEA